jgi:hypothetical protein
MRLNLMGTTERSMVGRFPFGWSPSSTRSQLSITPFRCLIIGFTNMSGTLNGLL